MSIESSITECCIFVGQFNHLKNTAMKTTLSMKLEKVLEYGSFAYSNEVSGFPEDQQKEFINKGMKLYKFTTDTERINTKVFHLTGGVFFRFFYCLS